MFDGHVLAENVKACLPDGMRSPVTGSFFLLVKRSVNWLPLSVSSLTILIGQACFTLIRKSVLLLSDWSA
jgi:hypothetical protein